MWDLSKFVANEDQVPMWKGLGDQELVKRVLFLPSLQ